MSLRCEECGVKVPEESPGSYAIVDGRAWCGQHMGQAQKRPKPFLDQVDDMLTGLGHARATS